MWTQYNWLLNVVFFSFFVVFVSRLHTCLVVYYFKQKAQFELLELGYSMSTANTRRSIDKTPQHFSQRDSFHQVRFRFRLITAGWLLCLTLFETRINIVAGHSHVFEVAGIIFRNTPKHSFASLFSIYKRQRARNISQIAIRIEKLLFLLILLGQRHRSFFLAIVNKNKPATAQLNYNESFDDYLLYYIHCPWDSHGHRRR